MSRALEGEADAGLQRGGCPPGACPPPAVCCPGPTVWPQAFSLKGHFHPRGTAASPWFLARHRDAT